MNQFQLKTSFRIESARFLPLLPEGHPCRNMHGHSFKIVLTLQGPLDPKVGWVRDYHAINEMMEPILGELDHHVLNEVKGLENPTSELLCKWIYDRALFRLPELKSVMVSETPDTECSYPV
jgi:6-pyruvoyltetrahydropterin/6-carboxytetrahydropterin synthase